jgi:hypothetical protein
MRRTRPRTESRESPRRATAQRHLDARGERLRAYAVVLEAAVAAGPPAGRRAQLDRQLARVRGDLQIAERARLPEPTEERGRAAAPAPGTGATIRG